MSGAMVKRSMLEAKRPTPPAATVLQPPKDYAARVELQLFVPQFLSLKQAKVYTGLGETLLLDLIDRGELRELWDGGARRFYRHELDRLSEMSPEEIEGAAPDAPKASAGGDR